jgi:hypothetical protein
MYRFETEDLAGFFVGFLPCGIAVVADMILGGNGWWLLGWLVIWLLLFCIWEGRVRCSHCPFWAEKSLVLHYHANYGVMKPWQFRPGPMSRLEKVLFGHEGGLGSQRLSPGRVNRRLEDRRPLAAR